MQPRCIDLDYRQRMLSFMLLVQNNAAIVIIMLNVQNTAPILLQVDGVYCKHTTMEIVIGNAETSSNKRHYRIYYFVLCDVLTQKC